MACSGGCGCSGTCGGSATATQHDAIDVIDAPPGCKCVCECVWPKGQTPVPTFTGRRWESAGPPAPPAPRPAAVEAWSAQVSGPDDLTAWFRARAASGVAPGNVPGAGGSASHVVGGFQFQSSSRRFVASFAAVPAAIPIARVRSSAPFGIAEPPRAPSLPTTGVPTQVASEQPLPTIDASSAPGRAAIRGRLSVAPPPGYIVPADGLRDGVGPSFPRREVLSPRWTGIARRNGPAASPIARALWDPFDETDPDPVSLRRVSETIAVSANGDGRPRALVADPRGPAVPDLVSLPSDVEEGSGFATNGVPEDSISDTADTTRDSETSEPATGVRTAASDFDAISPPTHQPGDSAAGAAVHPPQGSPGPGIAAAQRTPGPKATRSPGFGGASGPAVVAQAGRSMFGTIGPQAATGLEAASIADRGGRRGGGDFAKAAASAYASQLASAAFMKAAGKEGHKQAFDRMKAAEQAADRDRATLLEGERPAFSKSATGEKRLKEAVARLDREQKRQETVDKGCRNSEQANEARKAKAGARAARDAATAAKRALANLHGQGSPKANRAASKAVADWKKAARKAADAAKAAERAAKYGSAADAAAKLKESNSAAETLKKAAAAAAKAIADAKAAADAKEKDPKRAPPGPVPGAAPGGDPPKQPGDPPAPGTPVPQPENQHPECGPLPCGKCANPCSGWGSYCRCHWEIEEASGGGGAGGLSEVSPFGGSAGPSGTEYYAQDAGQGGGAGAPPGPAPVQPVDLDSGTVPKRYSMSELRAHVRRRRADIRAELAARYRGKAGKRAVSKYWRSFMRALEPLLADEFRALKDLEVARIEMDRSNGEVAATVMVAHLEFTLGWIAVKLVDAIPDSARMKIANAAKSNITYTREDLQTLIDVVDLAQRVDDLNGIDSASADALDRRVSRVARIAFDPTVRTLLRKAQPDADSLFVGLWSELDGRERDYYLERVTTAANLLSDIAPRVNRFEDWLGDRIGDVVETILTGGSINPAAILRSPTLIRRSFVSVASGIGPAARRASARGLSSIRSGLRSTRSGGGGSGRVVEHPRNPLDPVRERPMADHLAGKGKTVERLPQPASGRGADTLVDGVPSEFKKLDPGASSATVKNSVTESIKRGGQARDVHIDARGSGLSAAEAQRGLARLGHPDVHRGMLDNVTIVGDGFEVTRSFP